MEYNFKLTDTEADYIGGLLVKQPYSDVVLLLEKLRKQAAEQDKKTEVVAPEIPSE